MAWACAAKLTKGSWRNSRNSQLFQSGRHGDVHQMDQLPIIEKCQPAAETAGHWHGQSGPRNHRVTPAAFAANCVLEDSATLHPPEHRTTTDPKLSHSEWYKIWG